jgi:hypothetical protein
MQYATLQNGHPVECSKWHEWAEYMAISNRSVVKTTVGQFTVSTVFLGINHGDKVNPLWFETMIFDEHASDFVQHYQERYETCEQAIAGHHAAIAHAEVLMRKDS